MNERDYKLYIQSLEGRVILNNDHRKDLLFMQSGNDGEKYFKALLDATGNVCYFRNLEIGNNNHTQIDFLVISQNKLIIFEIKNCSGEWYFEENFMKSKLGAQIQSPFIQMKKIEHELRYLCNKLDINVNIESYVVFTNSCFILTNHLQLSYHNFILPHQLNSLSKIIPIKSPNNDFLILNKIKQYEKIHSKYYQRENFVEFNTIEKGIRCPVCKKLNTIIVKDLQKYNYCTYCETDVLNKEILINNLRELYCLKRAPFTIKEAIDWCSPFKERTVRRICTKYFLPEQKRNIKFSYNMNHEFHKDNK